MPSARARSLAHQRVVAPAPDDDHLPAARGRADLDAPALGGGQRHVRERAAGRKARARGFLAARGRDLGKYGSTALARFAVGWSLA